MKISENKLRSLVKQVIKESFHDEMMSHSGISKQRSHRDMFGLKTQEMDRSSMPSHLGGSKKMIKPHDLRREMGLDSKASFGKEVSLESMRFHGNCIHVKVCCNSEDCADRLCSELNSKHGISEVMCDKMTLCVRFKINC